MTTPERGNLVAPCGIDCGICELYLSRNNEQLKTYLLSCGIPADRIPCDGCRAIEGECPVLKGTCATYTCVEDNKVDFCYECGSFPCGKLTPAVDRANVLPHNTKAFNLCVIRMRGIEAFIEESADIKKRYFKGTMAVGEGPQLI